MKFGPIDIDEAEGAILAHSANTPDGKIKKGRQLSREDIAKLKRANVSTVITACLDADDIREDEAAAAIADAVIGPGVRVAEAFTGRANVFATADGILQVDRDALIALNRIDEGLTVATLPPYERVTAGQMVATIKIIPFAVSQATLSTALEQCQASAPLVSIAHFTSHKVGLVLTDLPGAKASLLDKRIKAISDRIEACGSTVLDKKIIPHERQAVETAAREMHAKGADPILIFGASAIVDREDVIPGGVVDAGGKVVHLGMPVDPGNLLLVAELEDRHVIGVPSCASSPKINGLDWVLERLLADIPVTSDDITAMAPGGLLMEIPTRPQPRAKATAVETTDNAGRYAASISAIVLASGRSTRMGESNKLLEDFKGKPLVRHAVDAAQKSLASNVTVVTGHEEANVREALSGLTVNFTSNPHFADGLATSLAAGIRALPANCDGAIILLGDMPLVSPELINQLIAAFAPHDGRSICVPFNNGRRGNPILWSSAFFSELGSLTGDQGARHLIAKYAEDLVEVDVDTDAIFADVDTPEALAALRGEELS
ncbi:MAG: molybdopterin-binding/glycosyltransferase family 2 protein [Pseudomonadota bacterium]